jgi:hypothetical protein
MPVELGIATSMVAITALAVMAVTVAATAVTAMRRVPTMSVMSGRHAAMAGAIAATVAEVTAAATVGRRRPVTAGAEIASANSSTGSAISETVGSTISAAGHVGPAGGSPIARLHPSNDCVGGTGVAEYGDELLPQPSGVRIIEIDAARTPTDGPAVGGRSGIAAASHAAASPTDSAQAAAPWTETAEPTTAKTAATAGAVKAAAGATEPTRPEAAATGPESKAASARRGRAIIIRPAPVAWCRTVVVPDSPISLSPIAVVRAVVSPGGPSRLIVVVAPRLIVAAAGPPLRIVVTGPRSLISPVAVAVLDPVPFAGRRPPIPVAGSVVLCPHRGGEPNGSAAPEACSHESMHDQLLIAIRAVPRGHPEVPAMIMP